MRIRYKALLLIFAIILGTGVVTVLVGRVIAANIVEDEIRDHLIDTARSRSQAVLLALESQKQALETLAREAETYMAIMPADAPNLLTEDRYVIGFMLSSLASSMKEVDDALYVDATGMVISSMSDRLLHYDAGAWEVFADFARGESRSFVGDIQSSAFGRYIIGDGAPRLILATAVPLWHGDVFKGVLIFLGGEERLAAITTDLSGMGKTGEAYLVSREGYLLTPSRFLDDAVLMARLDIGLPEGAEGAGDQDQQPLRLVSARNYMGSKVLRVSEPLPETGWTLVVERAFSEAFAPITSLTHAFGWALLGVALLGVLTALVVSTALSRPILRLHRAVEEVMRGNWDWDVSTTAKDEIGALSRAFSQMTAKLKAAQEELQRYSESLEVKVEERTAALAAANEELSREVIERKQAERALQEARDELEMRVEERTEQLARANVELEEEIAERQRAEEAMLQRNRELAALNAIAQTINESVDLDEMLTKALDKTLEILDLHIGTVYVLEPDGEILRARIQRGIPPEYEKPLSVFRVGEGVVGDVARRGEPVFIASLRDALSRIRPDAASLVLEQKLNSIMYVPLKARGDLCGVMAVVTEGEHVLTKPERDLIVTIGHQVGTAVKSAQLVREASRAKALEELDRLRNALLASVSHELRTPLTSIKGLASTLTQPDVQWDPETQREFLMIIDKEATILARIVGDLMEMSQIEAGVMRMEKMPINIGAIISQLRDQLGHLVNNHQFEMKVPRDLPLIYADEVRIGEVITNLVANAAAYSDPGTRIVLEARLSGSEVIVSVSDEGIGIPPEHQSKVFDRFYRLESGVARRRGGTGLGLSISKRIVEQHDGRIWLESKVGQGSTFSFSIPVAEAEMVRRGSHSSGGSAESSGSG